MTIIHSEDLPKLTHGRLIKINAKNLRTLTNREIRALKFAMDEAEKMKKAEEEFEMKLQTLIRIGKIPANRNDAIYYAITNNLI